MREVMIFAVLVTFVIGCGKVMNDTQRYISQSISCDTPVRCLSIGDSLNESSDWDLNWSLLSRADSLINFHSYSDAGSKATIFVKDYVEVAEAGEYLIRMGSDDGFQVFVNGEKTASRSIGRSVKPDSDWIPVGLSKGINEIIFQINQRDGGWGLYYQLNDLKISKELVQEHIPEIYRDLPEASILETGAIHLALDIDPRSVLDRFHNVVFQWVKPTGGQVVLKEAYSANSLPDHLKLPEEAGFPLVLEYSVIDEKKIIYQEKIPVFDEESVQEYIASINESDAIHAKWKEGMEILFAEELGMKKKKAFSIRVKAEYLWDLLTETGELFYPIGGARTELFNDHLARRYTPYSSEKEIEKVLGLHVDFSDSVRSYFMSYPGSSHALMTEWNSFAEYYNTELFFPFIVENKPRLTTQEVMIDYVSQEADSFSVIAWSKSTATLLNALEKKSYPIQHAGIISPWLIDKPTENFRLLHTIFKNNPHIHWSLYNGEEDEDVPRYITENWVTQATKIGFGVEWIQIPHSTHWTYWYSPEQNFLKRMLK